MSTPDHTLHLVAVSLYSVAQALDRASDWFRPVTGFLPASLTYCSISNADPHHPVECELLVSGSTLYLQTCQSSVCIRFEISPHLQLDELLHQEPVHALVRVVSTSIVSYLVYLEYITQLHSYLHWITLRREWVPSLLHVLEHATHPEQEGS